MAWFLNFFWGKMIALGLYKIHEKYPYEWINKMLIEANNDVIKNIHKKDEDEDDGTEVEESEDVEE